MTCTIDNNSVIELMPDPSAFISATTKVGRSGSQEVHPGRLLVNKQRPVSPAVNMGVEDFIHFQMSFIPEVEKVFVSRHNKGDVFRVLTIVNNRDRDLNRKIFAREEAIMDFYRHFRFDFHILARMNRDRNEIIYPSGTSFF